MVAAVVVTLAAPRLAGATWQPDEAFAPSCDEEGDSASVFNATHSVETPPLDAPPRRNVAQGLCRKHSKASPHQPRAYDASAPGDCFKLWWLTEHPKSPSPITMSPNAEWLAGWCTPQRERRLRDADTTLTCRELLDDEKWAITMKQIRRWFKANGSPNNDGGDASRDGGAGGTGGGRRVVDTAADQGVEPEFPFWTYGFFEVWQQHELATYLTPRSAECPWVVDALKFTCGYAMSCGEWYDRVLFKRRDIVWITVDPHDYLLMRDDAPLSPAIACVCA